MDKTQMATELKLDEGEVKIGGRHVVYNDHLGFATLGIGRLVDRRRGGGISDAEALMLLSNDIEERHQLLLRSMPVYKSLDAVRQRAVLNMSFQLGVQGVLEFKRMIAALTRRDYAAAAVECLMSDYGKQTPARAKRVADMIETGKPPKRTSSKGA